VGPPPPDTFATPVVGVSAAIAAMACSEQDLDLDGETGIPLQSGAGTSALLTRL
jgi:hypothetical protein